MTTINVAHSIRGCICAVLVAACALPLSALAQATGGDCASPPYDITAVAMARRGDPAFRQALADIRERYFRPNLRMGDVQAAASLDEASEELAFSALMDSVSQNAPNDFTWFLAPSHEEPGRAMPVPGSRFIFDNPDRIYRFTPLTGDRRYEIVGKVTDGKMPSLFVIEAVQSDGATGWGRPAAFLSSKDLAFEPDGTFRVSVSPDREDGRKNHLYTPPNADALLVRDTLFDWSRELPVQLSLRRADGSSPPSCGEKDDVVKRIETYARKQFSWIGSTAPKEDNRVGAAVVRGTAGSASWGMTAQGRYGLAKGQALLVTVDPAKARYLGLMLSDAWGRSIDYSQHSSSLNNSEVTANPDGTITYVISSDFPAKFNWLDTGGIRFGLFMVRWEFLDAPYDKARGEPVTVELTSITKLQNGMSKQQIAQAAQQHRNFIAIHRRQAFLARVAALYPVTAGPGSPAKTTR